MGARFGEIEGGRGSNRQDGSQMLKIGAFTDELTDDFEHALDLVAELGLEYVQVRTFCGTNFLDLSWDKVKQAKAMIEERKLKVAGLASPLLKCALPGYPEPKEGDSFGFGRRTYREHAELLPKAVKIARYLHTTIIRCFSFWKSVVPFEQAKDEIVAWMRPLVALAEEEGMVLALKNEPSCYAATAVEMRKIVTAVSSGALRIAWDPGDAVHEGGYAFPEAYETVKDFIVDVHLKDAWSKRGSVPAQVAPVGVGEVDYVGELAALERDGYRGVISLEPHYRLISGTKEDRVRTSLQNVLAILSRVQALSQA